MKNILLACILFISLVPAHAQTKGLFLRRDTVILTPDNSNWQVPPHLKNEYNTLSGYFLQAIIKGKLKATDPDSGKPIPANKIMTWNMPNDTVLRYDMEGNVTGTTIYERQIDPDKLKKIAIVQDWYLDPVTNKVYARTDFVQLYLEKQLSSISFVFLSPFCRIKY